MRPSSGKRVALDLGEMPMVMAEIMTLGQIEGRDVVGNSGKMSVTGANWVRPELVAEVTFLTWTADGLLRQVVYEGLREDKAARDVRRE